MQIKAKAPSNKPAQSKSNNFANKKQGDKTLASKQNHVTPKGRTLKTQDQYLPTDKKGKSIAKKTKRWVAVIDRNGNNELAVVRLTTQNTAKTTELKTYKNGNKKPTFFKHFLEIADNEGKPIKVDNKKFIENPPAFDLSPKELKTVQNEVYHKVNQAKKNNDKIKQLKQRDKNT